MLDSDLLHNIAAGRNVPPGTVSLLVPHFETPELARLCLRSVRRHTTVPFEAIVVDNGSRDGASLEYLRRVSWIRLIERPTDEVPPEAPLAHATALEIAMAAARGQFALAMHTDTIPLREGWLSELLAPMRSDERVAVVGADKLDAPPAWWAALKSLVDRKAWHRLACRATGREIPPSLRVRPRHARSYCALYRLTAVQRVGVGWVPEAGSTAGEALFHALVAAGYDARLMPARHMRLLVAHVAHATALLATTDGIRGGRVRRRTARRMRELAGAAWVRELMDDASLDER